MRAKSIFNWSDAPLLSSKPRRLFRAFPKLWVWQSSQRWIKQSAQRAGTESRGLGPIDFDAMTSTIAICGSPEEALDRMGVAAEMLQLDTQLLMMDLGGLPDAELYESIELAGSHVLPAAASL